MIETDQFKTNHLSVSFFAPLAAETASETALLPMVLRRGCAAFPNADTLNRELNGLYGATLYDVTRKRGEAQVFGLAIDLLADRYALNGEALLERGCSLLAQLICAPKIIGDGFDPEFVKTERENLVEGIESELSDKRVYALNRCIALMCQDEAFGVGRLGTAERAAAVSEKRLYQRYQEVLQAAPVEIFFIGDPAGIDVKGVIQKAFAGLGKRSGTLPGTKRKAAGILREVTEQVPATQGKLVIGFRTGVEESKKGYDMAVMNALFGGSVVSKLFVNVREKMSLCYYCSSRTEKEKGLLLVSSGIENDKKEVAQQQIFKELEDIRQGKFTEEEFGGAVKTLVNAYREMNDSQHQMEGFQLGQLQAGTNDTVEDAIRALSKVTKEEVIAAAKRAVPELVYFLEGVQK